VYVSNASLQEERIVTKVNNRLSCPSTANRLRSGYLYSDGVPHLKYVPTTMEFLVKEVHDSGSSNVFSRIAVLKDVNGIESTAFARSIETPGHFCLNLDAYEISQESINIFKTIEKNGTAKIQVLNSAPTNGGGSRIANRTSTESIRSSFISYLPSRYTFSNVTPIETTATEDGFSYLRYGVNMNVDGEAFSLLLMQKFSNNVESITLAQ